MRWVVALMALPVGVAVAVPAVAQSPSAGAVSGAAVLERALAGLDELDSYRLENQSTSTLTGDAELATPAVVVNVQERAYDLRIGEGGEVAWNGTPRRRTPGSRTHGGPFRTQEDAGWSFCRSSATAVGSTRFNASRPLMDPGRLWACHTTGEMIVPDGIPFSNSMAAGRRCHTRSHLLSSGPSVSDVARGKRDIVDTMCEFQRVE